MWNYTNRDPDYLFDDDEVPFEYREPYRPGTKITDKSFLIIPNISKADFEKLNTSKPLNELENACLPVYQAYRSYYTILGYTILALKGVDIQPSITYIMMNYPTKEIQKYPDGTMYEDSEIDIEQPVCESYSVGNNNAIPYVVHKYGVVGTDCFPNTAVPGSTTECSQKDGKFEKYLVGYKQGIFQGDADVMKEALIKFGPVYVYGSHEIFIGWDENYWITIGINEVTHGYQLSNEPFYTSLEFRGYVYASYLGDDTAVIPPADCIGKTEAECPCSSVDGDQRQFCKTCTAKDTPSSECKCPAVKEGDYTKAQCEADKAATGKEASGSVRMTLGMIAAAVVLPVLALFV